MSPKLRPTMPSTSWCASYDGECNANSERPADVENGAKGRIFLVKSKSCDLRDSRENIEENPCGFGHHSNFLVVAIS